MCFFIPNQPRPIFCPLIVRSENNIINPVVPTTDFGFFYNTAPGEIETEEIIPLILANGRGSSITSSTTTSGAITLAPGTYEVSYLASGILPENGEISIELEMNGGDVVGSNLTETGTAGNQVSLGQTMIISVSSISILELVNNSAVATEFVYASVAINRL